jgi:hypothetical protein
MSEDVTIHKFFDDPMLLELARQVGLEGCCSPLLSLLLLSSPLSSRRGRRGETDLPPG